MDEERLTAEEVLARVMAVSAEDVPELIAEGRGIVTDLRDDERAWIEDTGRCDTCGHLWAFHNDHCCSFCLVPDCECENR